MVDIILSIIQHWSRERQANLSFSYYSVINKSLGNLKITLIFLEVKGSIVALGTIKLKLPFKVTFFN